MCVCVQVAQRRVDEKKLCVLQQSLSVLLEEWQQLQAESRSGVVARSKLESLCRELQGHYSRLRVRPHRRGRYCSLNRNSTLFFCHRPLRSTPSSAAGRTRRRGRRWQDTSRPCWQKSRLRSSSTARGTRSCAVKTLHWRRSWRVWWTSARWEKRWEGSEVNKPVKSTPLSLNYFVGFMGGLKSVFTILSIVSIWWFLKFYNCFLVLYIS